MSINEAIRQARYISATDVLCATAVMKAVVYPILLSLGWRSNNIRRVHRDHWIGNESEGVVLTAHRRNLASLAVVNSTNSLAISEEALLSYCRRFAVPLAVLTNRLDWYFYLPLIEASSHETNFYTVNIALQDDAITAFRFSELLSRKGVESGTVVAEVEALYEKKIQFERAPSVAREY